MSIPDNFILNHTQYTYPAWPISPKIVSLRVNSMQLFPKWHTFPLKHVSLRKKCIKFTVDIPWETQFWAEKSVSLRENFKRWRLIYLFEVQMKPIHEFNEFLEKNIGNIHSSREKTFWILKIYIFTENMCH